MAGTADPTLCVLGIEASLRDAVNAIERSKMTIAVVVDLDNRILGTVSNGDIRRAILRGLTLQECVDKVMNRTPVIASEATPDVGLRELIDWHELEAIPVVGKDGRLRRVVHITDLTGHRRADGAEGFSAAVIMAGGRGKRLYPMTEYVPKPMLEVGGTPLIERQIRYLASAGVRQVYVAVNYLSDVIEQHLSFDERYGLKIDYLRELTELGTAGALSLIDRELREPMLVVNGHVVTTSEFGNFLRYHNSHHADNTMGAIMYHINIPFGVLRIEGADVRVVEEKPSQRFLCNAGIYVLEPAVLGLIPR